MTQTRLGQGYPGHMPAGAPQLGQLVAKAATLVPQTATASIFRVNGGPCVIYLLGRFTVAASGTATNLTVANTTGGAAADRGANTNLSSATAITSAAIGSLVQLGATVGAALTVGAGAILLPAAGMIVNPGTIDLTTSASNATATIAWSLYFVPLAGSAYVNAL